MILLQDGIASRTVMSFRTTSEPRVTVCANQYMFNLPVLFLLADPRRSYWSCSIVCGFVEPVQIAFSRVLWFGYYVFNDSCVSSNVVITSLWEQGLFLLLTISSRVYILRFSSIPLDTRGGIRSLIAEPPRNLLFEPAHEIIELFVLRELILQTCMCSHPVGLDVWILVGPFVCFHISCVWTAKALVRLRGCAGLPEPSLVAYVISTIISWAGSIVFFYAYLDETSMSSKQKQTIWHCTLFDVVLIIGDFLCLCTCTLSQIRWYPII